MRVCSICGHLSPTKKHFGIVVAVWFKVCLKYVTDVEFLCSSLRLFQSLIIEKKGIEVLTCPFIETYVICISKIISRGFIDNRWYKR